MVENHALHPADVATLQLNTFLPYRLNVVTQAVSQALARLYSEEFGISIPEWRILAALGEEQRAGGPDWPGMTARDLARHGSMGKVMVSRAAAALVQRKLLIRRANTADRRESFLQLSRKGTGIYMAIVPRAHAFQEQLARGISSSDARAFDRVVRHLMKAAGGAEAVLLEDA